MGASSPFAEMLTHFTRTPYRIAGFRKGKGEESRASDFTGKWGSVRAKEEGRRVEWNRHTFLAMFAAMTIYLSAADRAAALPAMKGDCGGRG